VTVVVGFGAVTSWTAVLTLPLVEYVLRDRASKETVD